MINPNEVAFIKTTGEAVFILSVREDVATVRRPVAGQNGVHHVADQFTIYELETVDEQRDRYMTEQKKTLEKYGPKVDQQNAAGDPGFGIN